MAENPDNAVRLQFVRALDAWVNVEHQLGTLFYFLLKPMAYPKSQILFQSMNGFQAQRDAVEVLVQDTISDQAILDPFSQLVDRLRRLATKRNRLIHGKWMNVDVGHRKSLARLYIPPNLKIAEPGKSLISAKGKFVFLLDDLRRAELEFEALAVDLQKFGFPLAAKLGVSPAIEIPAEDILELKIERNPPSGHPPEAT